MNTPCDGSTDVPFRLSTARHVLRLFIALFLGLTGCGGGSTPAGDVVAAISTDGLSSDFYSHPYFPHPDNWQEASVHGTRSLSSAQTMTDCLVCHDGESTNLGSSDASGASGTEPAGCKACHETYPHVADWVERDSHGQFVADSGTTACSGACHGTDFSGGLSGISCNTCHTVFPHAPDTWKNSGQHGAALLELGASACQGCHGAALDGGTSGVGCKNCHAQYPHDSATWNTQDEHGQVVLQEGPELCSGCHGADLTGGVSGVSCSQCHATYPHAADWASVAEHGAAAQGQGKRLCVGCHGDDLQGGNTGSSCYQCHASYPHDNNTVPWDTPELWSEATAHGAYVAEQGLAECAGACHGSDLAGGTSGISCLTGCHTAPYPHPAGWNTEAQRGATDHHGTLGGGSGKTQCMSCHGEDLAGGTSGVSCFTCHPDYPHTDRDWVAGGMDNEHATLFIELVQDGATARCTVCHGQDYSREVGGIACTSCHANGVTHTSGWSAGAGHGTFFSTHSASDDSSQTCQDCHGAPVAFTDTRSVGLAPNTCSNCHAVSPRSTAQTPSELQRASSCYTCHWAYPHIGYEVANSTGTTVIQAAWGPTVGDLTGNEQGLYYGHLFYQFRNPNFVDASGNELSLYSPFVSTGTESDIIANTCGGGTAGSCHYAGWRSQGNNEANSALCSLYCHQK